MPAADVLLPLAVGCPAGVSVSAPVRVGLLGCGRIARLVHLRALTTTPGVALTALADADPAALAAASRACIAATPFRDWRDLLERGEVEAVVIALPTPLHAAAARAAFARGLAVYVEKPLAATVADAAAIAAAWRAAGTVGRTGHNLRHHPRYLAARDLVAAGAVGTVVAGRAQFSSAPRELPGWKRSRTTGGGALLDLASHCADLARFLTGREVLDVGGRTRSVRHEDDTAVLDLGLDDGTVVSVLVSSTIPARDRFEIAGDAGLVAVDRFGRRDVEVVGVAEDRSPRVRLRAAASALGGVRDALLPPGEPSFAASFAAFAAAVRGAPVEGATIEDGLRAVAIVEAAERAARSGRRVAVNTVLAEVA